MFGTQTCFFEDYICVNMWNILSYLFFLSEKVSENPRYLVETKNLSTIPCSILTLNMDRILMRPTWSVQEDLQTLHIPPTNKRFGHNTGYFPTSKSRGLCAFLWTWVHRGIVGEYQQHQAFSDFQNFLRPLNLFASEAVYTRNFFSTACWTACKHAFRFLRVLPEAVSTRQMACIHAGVSRSPREHASVPPDKRHCRRWMSEFLTNPFIHDLFCWSSRHKFVKTDL